MDKILGPFNGLSFEPGDRVELHPATDLWMRGARFGTVKKIVGKRTTAAYLRVHVDAINRTVAIGPDNIYAITETAADRREQEAVAAYVAEGLGEW